MVCQVLIYYWYNGISVPFRLNGWYSLNNGMKHVLVCYEICTVLPAEFVLIVPMLPLREVFLLGTYEYAKGTLDAKKWNFYVGGFQK